MGAASQFFPLTSVTSWSKIRHVFPGVAQLVGRLIWVLSDPMFPEESAIRKTVAALALFSLDFSKTAV